VLLCPYFVVTSGPSSLWGGKGIMSALPASRPCERGTAVGHAVSNKKGKALLCFVYVGLFGDISSQRISLSLNVLESRQLSISCVSEQRLPRELLIK
jgi:hypothetical protein